MKMLGYDQITDTLLTLFLYVEMYVVGVSTAT